MITIIKRETKNKKYFYVPFLTIKNDEEYKNFISEFVLKNLFSLDNIKDLIPSVEDDLEIKLLSFVELIKENIKQKFKNLQRQQTYDYWIARGYSEEESKSNIEEYTRNSSKRCKEYWLKHGCTEEQAIEEIKLVQRKSSNRCEEYWLNHGYTEEQAKNEVKNIQSRNGKKANEKIKEEYWLSKGHSKEDSKNIVEALKDERSCFRKEFWINKGFSEEEAKEKIIKNAKNNALPSLIEKYGDIEGNSRYIDYNKRKAVYGEKNAQYGKPAPKGSGRGISGYYKNYYFRSMTEYFFIKYCEENSIKFHCNDVAIKNNKSKITIPYIDETGTKRNYIPDFIINDTVIVEIKNSYALTTQNWKNKKEALENFLKTCYTYTEYKCISENDFDSGNEQDICTNDYFSGALIIDEGKSNVFLKRYKINESNI
jgi:hypothetical protein